MNSKMTTNSQLSTNELKGRENKMKTKTKQRTRQEQNQRNGHHTEGVRWEGGGRNRGGKVKGIRSIISRHNIDRER